METRGAGTGGVVIWVCFQTGRASYEPLPPLRDDMMESARRCRDQAAMESPRIADALLRIAARYEAKAGAVPIHE